MSVDDLFRERRLTFAAQRLPGFDPTNVSVELHDALPAGVGVLEEIGVFQGCKVFVVKSGIKIIGLVSLLGTLHVAGEAISPGTVPDPVSLARQVHIVGQQVYREVTDPHHFDPLVHRRAVEKTAIVETVYAELCAADGDDPCLPNGQPIMPPATTTTTLGPPPFWGGAATGKTVHVVGEAGPTPDPVALAAGSVIRSFSAAKITIT